MTVIDRAGDIDEFTRLKAEKDMRTITEMIADDEYADVIVEKAVPYKDDSGYWTVEWNHGIGTAVKAPEGVEIKVGDTIRFYGRHAAGLGGIKHGWALNGEVMEWRTPWERFAERVRWLADYDRRRRENFANSKDKLDAQYEALSLSLKARIDRFRAERADFRIDSESYELFCCVEADKIADYLRPRVEAGEDAKTVVEEFRDLPWAEQVKAGVDEGHSGDTFGGACYLAYAVLTGGPYSGRCPSCGSARWVSVSFDGGWTRVPQCVPCGAIHPATLGSGLAKDRLAGRGGRDEGH